MLAEAETQTEVEQRNEARTQTKAEQRNDAQTQTKAEQRNVAEGAVGGELEVPRTPKARGRGRLPLQPTGSVLAGSKSCSGGNLFFIYARRSYGRIV